MYTHSIQDYFILQGRMLHRRFHDSGFPPVLGYAVLMAVFLLGSVYLFHKTELAEYMYVLLALSLTGPLSETRRNEFLQLCFGFPTAKKIRLIENLSVVFPFLIFLAFQKCFLSAGLLAVFSVGLALIRFRITFQFTLPTPFYKQPFEFTVGFRNTFYLLFAAYALTTVAVVVDNFNLGVFALLLSFALISGYYTKPEDEYYVWIYNASPKRFLFKKLKTVLLYSSWLILPIFALLGIVYYTQIVYLLLFLLAGYAFITCILFAKYSAYPDEIGIKQGILIAFCLFFPPLLLLVIPYFFSQSVQRLNPLLK